MELRGYLQLLQKFWASILAATMLGIAAAAVYSLVVTPAYTASTSLFITVQNATTVGELASGSTYAERQVRSFAEVAEAPIVLQPVIDDLHLGTTPEMLAEKVSVSVPTNTSILDVNVVDADPQRAASITGAIADRLVEAVKEIAPTDAQGRASVEATVVTPATVPLTATNPRVPQNLLLGALLGLLVGVGQALIRRMLDTKVRNVEDIAALTEVPVVGTVAWDDRAGDHPLPVRTDPTSLRAEEYRRVRTNLQFLGVDDESRTIAFTSSVAGEGKTITIVNVALALADAGKRVLLIDADLRRPRVAERLNLEGSVGLTTILIGRASLGDVVQPVEGLDVLPAGQTPPNPSEMLGSEGMRALLERASRAYDYVLLDAAPLVPVADTAVLSTFLGGVVILVGSGQVESSELADAIEAITATDGHVLGLVLNKLRAQDAGHRRNQYYYREAYAALSEDAPSERPVRKRRFAVAAPARAK